MKKRFLSTLIVLAMLLGILYIAPMSTSAAEATEGLSFDADHIYSQTNPVSATPKTFEAWIKLPAGYTERAGAIMGSLKTGVSYAISFEIYTNGNPSIYWWDSTGEHRVTFGGVNVATGEWVHLVISITDDNKTMYCYVNSSFKQQKTTTDKGVSISYPTNLAMQTFAVGSDRRDNNPIYFKGEIKSAAIYDKLMKHEPYIVTNYANGTPTLNENTIAAYDLTETVDNGLYINDLSGNGNTLSKLGGEHSFVRDKFYEAAKPIDQSPRSFEAWIKLPAGYTDRGGIILGTVGPATTPVINFEIKANGQPALYWQTRTNKVHEIIFNKANVATGEWVHLVITRYTDGNSYCYVNGKFIQGIAMNDYSKEDQTPFDSFILGGDYRFQNDPEAETNLQYFKGQIKSVAMYSEALHSSNDIEKNYAAGKPVSEKSLRSLICYYDLVNTPVGATTIKDSAGNGYDLTKHSSDVWLDADHPEKEEVRDYDYTFAVVGDTQTLLYKTPEKFKTYYDWIINNKDAQKLEFVFGLGDITDKNTTEEWETAMPQILRMKEAGIPYSLARGNHDKIPEFNQYYPYSEYNGLVDGTFDETMLNTYQKLTVGNRKYLIFVLDYGAADDILAWAEDIIVAHPDYNVIITTHSYLYRDGTTCDDGDVDPPSKTGGYNNGDDMWEKLVRKYENISLVIGGHDGSSRIVTRKDTGDNGNVVTSMLVNPQFDDANKGGLGLIALLRFSEDSDDVQVEYYSPITGKYFRAYNQFTITLDLQEFEHTFVNGFCTECGEWDGETAVLLGANVVLNNNLKVNYYAKLPETYKNAQMKFTMNGKETLADAIYIAEIEQYMFVFDNIPPQCIGDNIKAELILGGNVIAEKDGYSVLQYAKNTMERYAGYEKTVYLVKAVLAYGAAAQQYAKYKTDTLVNAGYEIDPVIPDVSVSVKAVKNNTGDAVFKAAGVYFDSVNRLYVKILAEEKPTVTVNGAEALVEENGEGEWIVYTEGIFVIDFDTVYTFVITSNANLPSFTYSVNSYTYAKLTSKNEAMRELAKATYAYGAAAKNYITNDNPFNSEDDTLDY